MKRPLGFVALLYGGGLLLGEFFRPPPAFLFAISFGTLAGALLLPRFRGGLLVPLLILTGWTNFAWHTAVLSPCDLRRLQSSDAAIVTLEGRLRDTPAERLAIRNGEERLRTVATLDVESMTRDPNPPAAADGKVIAVTRGLLPSAYFAGRRVRITGILAPPPGATAPGMFDYQSFLRRQDIYYELKAESSNDWQVLPSAAARPWADRFREWSKTALTNGLPQADASARLEQALFTGEKTVLTDPVAEPFMRAGTYHIFAVDGLRLSILFGLVFTLLRAVRVPRAICGAVLIPSIWFYVALTGWPASAVRAAVMLTIVVAGWAIKRPGDLFNSLFGAALVILLWDPQQLFEAGFQLSFFVVLCILLVMPVFDAVAERLLRGDPLLPDELRPRWQRMLRRPARIVLALAFSSLAAWIGSLPLVAYYFNLVTPVSTPANLLAVPLCGLVLASNVVSLLFAGWWPAAADPFNHAGWFFMECIRTTSIWFENWPRAWFYVAAPSLLTIFLYYATLVSAATGWLFEPRFRNWKWATLGILSIAWCLQEFAGHATTQLTVLPLNGASAVYCDAPWRANDVLVNCGDTNAVDFTVKPFLRAQGVNTLSCFALTHGETRSIGGCALVESLFPVQQFTISQIKFRSATYRQIIADLQKKPERRRVVSPGDRIANWTVLHPAAESSFAQANDSALVLRGDFAGHHVLLLSELGRPGQESLLARGIDLQADIVVAGIPGKGEPLCEGLLDAIRPRLIVIVDADLPPSKRASTALRDRLSRRGIPVLYTRTSRAVTFLFHGNDCRVEAMDGFARTLE
jgi:competence protein ComEC